MDHGVLRSVTGIEEVTPSSFEQFAAAQVGSLLALARVLTDNQEDAEELVQDSLIRIFRYWRRVSNAENPPAYARRVLVNQFRRSLSRRRLMVKSLSDLDDRASSNSDVDLLAERLTVVQGIRDLPAQQRTVVVLRFYLQLNTREIADWTGTAESSVRANLSRALKRLRRLTGLSNEDEGNHNAHAGGVDSARTEAHERK